MPFTPDQICKCLRCGYQWVKRVDKRPERCPAPNCKQRNWDIPLGKLKPGPVPKKKAIKKRRTA